MIVIYGRNVYDLLPEADKIGLKEMPCECTEGDGCANAQCELCCGHGVVHYYELSEADASAIFANLERQGLPMRPKEEN